MDDEGDDEDTTDSSASLSLLVNRGHKDDGWQPFGDLSYFSFPLQRCCRTL